MLLKFPRAAEWCKVTETDPFTVLGRKRRSRCGQGRVPLACGPGLSQLLVAAAGPWLVDASLQFLLCLHLVSSLCLCHWAGAHPGPL